MLIGVKFKKFSRQVFTDLSLIWQSWILKMKERREIRLENLVRRLNEVGTNHEAKRQKTRENYFGVSSVFTAETEPTSTPSPASARSSHFGEPVTLPQIRLKSGARDIGAAGAHQKWQAHKVHVKNHWVNAFQSVNAGNGNAHLSNFIRETVNYYECYQLASDPMMANVYDILTTTTFAKGGGCKSPAIPKHKIDLAEVKFKVTDTAKRALRSSFVVGGCLVYLDFGDHVNLEEPLNLEKAPIDKFKGFRVIDPINLTALEVEMVNVTSPFYMVPQKWYVVGLGVVHASHFLKFEENVPEPIMRPLYMYFGIPLTQLIKGDVANANLVSQGVANLIGRFRNTYLKSPDSSFGTMGGAQQFKARLETMAVIQDNFSVMPLKSEEDILQLTTTLSGLYENVELFYQLISAHTSIPIEKLLGKSATGLSATGEGSRINFYDKIRNIQSNIKCNLITMLSIAISACDGGKYKQITDYEFNPLEEDWDDRAQATLKGNVEIAKSLVEMGADAESVISWLSGKFDAFKDIKFDSDTGGHVGEGVGGDGGDDEDEGGDDPEPGGGRGRGRDAAKTTKNWRQENKGVEEKKGSSKLKEGVNLFTFNNDFKESEHPRDHDGRFTDGNKGVREDGRQDGDEEADRRRQTYKPTDDFRRVQEESQRLSDEDVKAFHNDDKQIDEGVRSRLANVFRRELATRSCGLRNVTRILTNPKTNKQLKFYSGVDANTFHDIFEIVQKYLPKGDVVDVHDAKDYVDNTNYLTSDGLSGFSITKDGDLISVFSLGESGFLRTIQPIIKEKVKTLDCFNSKLHPLPAMYTKAFGFKVASILDFNYDILVEFKGKEYADYFVKTYGEAPVAFMVNVPCALLSRRFGKDEYDAAKSYQKKCLMDV